MHFRNDDLRKPRYVAISVASPVPLNLFREGRPLAFGEFGHLWFGLFVAQSFHTRIGRCHSMTQPFVCLASTPGQLPFQPDTEDRARGSLQTLIRWLGSRAKRRCLRT
jgi:hypothetical protein